MRTTARIALSATLLVLAFSSRHFAYAADGPFAGVHVAANRHQYTGSGCPIDIIYTATLTFASPHPKGFVFNYHWERSDGAKGPERVVRPSEGQHSMSLRETWHLGAHGQHYDASVTFFANSGNTHISQASPTVSVTCK